jgi:hypothetical protein
MKYEATGKRTEGTVTVPPAAPALCDNDVLPVGGVIAFLGKLICLSEIPVERSA